MKKERILSLILSVMLMFTIVFPTGVFAEDIETQDNEPAVEEIVVGLGNDDASDEDLQQATEQDDEEPVADPIEEMQDKDSSEEAEVVVSEVEEAASEETALVAAEEEELAFEQGYVRVNGGTTVYAAESKKEEKGSFSADAVVYATVSTRAADEANSWLRIVFDTAEAREAGEALSSGYVQFKNVNVLSDEAVEQLTESLKNDGTVRSYNEELLPVVSFVLKAEVVVEEAVVEETDEIFEVGLAEATALAITKEPDDVVAPAGSQVTLTIVASGDGLTYQWQTKNSPTSGWANTGLTGAKTDTLSFKPTEAFDGRKYRCIVKDSQNNTVISREILLKVELIIDSVKYEKLDDTSVMVSEYLGTKERVVIPQEVDGYTVTQIGPSAFENNISLKSIDLPDTIAVIGKRAFAGCANLSQMD